MTLAPMQSSFTNPIHPAMRGHPQSSLKFVTSPFQSSNTLGRSDPVVCLTWSITIDNCDIVHGLHTRHCFCIPGTTEVCQMDVAFTELGRDGEV